MLMSFYPEVSDSSDPDPKNLIVNYIPTPVRDAQLRKLFEPFGEIESVRVILDRVTSHPKGYGFVKYTTEEAAKKAIQVMNGYEIGNKRLRVTRANGPQHRGAAVQACGDRQPSAPEAMVSSQQQQQQQRLLFNQPPPPAPSAAYPNDLGPTSQFPYTAFFPQHILSYQTAPTAAASSAFPADCAVANTTTAASAAALSQASLTPPHFSAQTIAASAPSSGMLLPQTYTVVGAAGTPMYVNINSSSASNLSSMFYANTPMSGEAMARSTAGPNGAAGHKSTQPMPCNLLPTQQAHLMTTSAASMPLLVKMESMPYEVMTNGSLPPVCYNSYNLFMGDGKDVNAASPNSDNSTVLMSNPLSQSTTPSAAANTNDTSKLISRTVPSYASLYGLSTSVENLSLPSGSTNNLSNVPSSASLQTNRLGQSVGYSSCRSLSSFQDGIAKSRAGDGRF